MGFAKVQWLTKTISKNGRLSLYMFLFTMMPPAYAWTTISLTAMQIAVGINFSMGRMLWLINGYTEVCAAIPQVHSLLYNLIHPFNKTICHSSSPQGSIPLSLLDMGTVFSRETLHKWMGKWMVSSKPPKKIFYNSFTRPSEFVRANYLRIISTRNLYSA